MTDTAVKQHSGFSFGQYDHLATYSSSGGASGDSRAGPRARRGTPACRRIIITRMDSSATSTASAIREGIRRGKDVYNPCSGHVKDVYNLCKRHVKYARGRMVAVACRRSSPSLPPPLTLSLSLSFRSPSPSSHLVIKGFSGIFAIALIHKYPAGCIYHQRRGVGETHSIINVHDGPNTYRAEAAFRSRQIDVLSAGKRSSRRPSWEFCQGPLPFLEFSASEGGGTELRSTRSSERQHR